MMLVRLCIETLLAQHTKIAARLSGFFFACDLVMVVGVEG